MSKTGTKAARMPASPDHGHATAAPGDATHLSEDDTSKDAFFADVAGLAEAMIARHGKDFAIGTLVLAAKFIAEGKPLINRGHASS